MPMNIAHHKQKLEPLSITKPKPKYHNITKW